MVYVDIIFKKFEIISYVLVLLCVGKNLTV